MAGYLRALKQELAARAAWLAAVRAAPERMDTVFFGGGTPTLLAPQAIAGLLAGARARFPIAPDAEVSLECNPGTVTAQTLADYRAAGVNRLSIGLQSANDGLLRRIGRIHTRAEFEEAFRAARSAGFDNVNVDVMHGLPGQSEADYLATLAFVCALRPEHISAYGLILEESTPLAQDVVAGREALPEPDAIADMQDAGMAYLAAQGYERYEISNFALPGRACRHNVNYWENGPYLGLGAAAHSAWRVEGRWRRFENPATLAAYRAASARPPHMQTIALDEERFETIMLGLRMTRGVCAQAFRRRFGVLPEAAYPAAIARLRARGWLAADPHALRLTPLGMDFQNSALLEFLS